MEPPPSMIGHPSRAPEQLVWPAGRSITSQASSTRSPSRQRAASRMQELSRSILNGVDHDAELRVRSCIERLRERVRDGIKDAFMFALGARRGVRHTVTASFERCDAILEALIKSNDALGRVLSAYRDSIAGGLSCIDRLRSARQSLDGELAGEL